MHKRNYIYFFLAVALSCVFLIPAGIFAQGSAPGIKGGDLLLNARRVMPANRPNSWYQAFYEKRYNLKVPGIHAGGTLPNGQTNNPFQTYASGRQWLRQRYPMLATAGDRGARPPSDRVMPAERPFSWYRAMVQEKMRRVSLLRIQSPQLRTPLR